MGGSNQFSSVPVPVRFWQNFGSRFSVPVRFCYVVRLKPDEEVEFFMLGKIGTHDVLDINLRLQNSPLLLFCQK